MESRLRKTLSGYSWVALLMLASSVVYAGGLQKKRALMGTLDEHITVLQKQKSHLLEEQQELTMQIASQSDPAWIELTLMKTLGLVPEGSAKVYFYKKTE